MFRVTLGARGFFSLLFAAKTERQSRDHHNRCFAAQFSPQTTGKKTLWHLGYFRVRGTDQKIQKCRKAGTLAFCSNKRRENATRGISWLTGTFHVFKFNQSAVTTSLAFSHATLNDSLLILQFVIHFSWVCSSTKKFNAKMLKMD